MIVYFIVEEALYRHQVKVLQKFVHCSDKEGPFIILENENFMSRI